MNPYLVIVLVGMAAAALFIALSALFGAPRPRWTGPPRPKWTGKPGVYRRIIRREERPDGQTKLTLDCGHQRICHMDMPPSEARCDVCTEKASE